MSVFIAAIDNVFCDPNIARDAVYVADGGTPVLVRVVMRRADDITGFGDARLWSETTRIDKDDILIVSGNTELLERFAQRP